MTDDSLCAHSLVAGRHVGHRDFLHELSSTRGDEIQLPVDLEVGNGGKVSRSDHELARLHPSEISLQHRLIDRRVHEIKLCHDLVPCRPDGEAT